MFDIGFWELALIAVIGLIVLGPERLPVVARTLGQWVGRARGYVRGITSELDREIRLQEMREHFERTRQELSDKGNLAESEIRETGDSVREAGEDARRALDAASASGESHESGPAEAGGEDDTPRKEDGGRDQERNG